MDIKKIKSLNVMAAKYKHNYREITVPNAVPELSGMNRELVPLIGKDGNPVDYNEAFKQKMESLVSADFYFLRQLLFFINSIPYSYFWCN